MAKIVKPMTCCLKKKEKVTHTPEFLESFEKCKNILSNDPVLVHPDFSQPFELTTDASNYAIGSVLSQKGKPICYASRTLSQSEINYSTIEKELLSIVWSCKNFRPYLYGRKFKIFTDHKPLQWLFSLKEPNSKLVRWRLRLEEYDYEICYKKGKENKVADALSRIRIEELNALTHISDLDETSSMIVNLPDLADIELEQNLDTEQLDEILQNLENSIPDTSQSLENPIPTTSQTVEKLTTNTQHTAHEEPILTLPYTDKPLNTYKNQIIISDSNNTTINTSSFQLLFDTKRRNIITFKTTATDEEILHFLKPFLNLQETNCFYFKSKEIEHKIIRVLRTSLKFHNKKIFIISTKWLEDIINEQDKQELIHYYHQGKTAHRGINEVTTSLKRLYYWPNLETDVSNFINQCVPCLSAKYDRNPERLKFKITETPSKPLEKLHLDVFQIQNTLYLTVFDPFSKLGHAYQIKDKTALEIILAFLQFISHYGIPKQIVTDNGREFSNQLMKDFCLLHKIDFHLITPHHSTSNSPVERFHSTLLDLYRTLSVEHPNHSVQHKMLLANIGYNNSIHSITKHTPFETILGSRSHPFDITPQIIVSDYIQNHKNLIEVTNAKIRENIENTKTKQITKLNENRDEPRTLEPDETVHVKTFERNKAAPKFKKQIVVQNKEDKIVTNRGLIHKQNLRRPRKIRPTKHQPDIPHEPIELHRPNVNRPNKKSTNVRQKVTRLLPLLQEIPKDETQPPVRALRSNTNVQDSTKFRTELQKAHKKSYIPNILRDLI